MQHSMSQFWEIHKLPQKCNQRAWKWHCMSIGQNEHDHALEKGKEWSRRWQVGVHGQFVMVVIIVCCLVNWFKFVERIQITLGYSVHQWINGTFHVRVIRRFPHERGIPSTANIRIRDIVPMWNKKSKFWKHVRYCWYVECTDG